MITEAAPEEIAGGHDGRLDRGNGQRKLQQLIQQAGELRDPVARALFHECLHSLLAFYGDGLARILQIARDSESRAGARTESSPPVQPGLIEQLTRDPGVCGLLLIHGLHPLDLAARVGQALEKVRPYMESHGGNVELLSLQADVARFRLHGACKTCPSSSVTMELALRRAIEEACPDLVAFEVE